MRGRAGVAGVPSSGHVSKGISQEPRRAHHLLLTMGGTGRQWRQELFKNEELINYLTALQVNHSVYEYIVYDSQVEREFAQKLDGRTDIKLFVKLPGWFEIDTPIGKYNPDWAILKARR
jgi:restriction endonuclease